VNQPRPLSIGDLVPPIGLPSSTGKIFDLTHQAVAGYTMVLWLAGSHPDPAGLAQFAAILPQLHAFEAVGYAVAAAPPGPSPSEAVSVLFDPQNLIAPPFGLIGPGIVVYDADRRLAAVLPDRAFAAAVQVCERLFAATRPQTVQRQAPVLVLPGVIEPSLCAALIAYWERGDKKSDAVATVDGRDYAAPGVKKRLDVIVSDPALTATLQDRIIRRIAPEVAKAYQRRVGYLEVLRIGCYDASSGGYFRRHRDNATRFSAHRLFAITINLNTGQYQGGALRFPEYGRMVYAPDAGGAVVFSCALLHEAQPVTEGRRFGVFTFMHDEAGEQQVQKLIAEQEAAGKRGDQPVSV
jgi:predicted 2-oxoglutarate/Fe(II)-dependent dioxygenase YbiX